MMGLTFLLREGWRMNKHSVERTAKMAFAEGCKSYLANCKQRNLREGTIAHYRQSYDQFFRYFDADMPLEEFSAEKY